MVVSSSSADFGFRIDFVRNTENPSRIFRTFSGLIDFCQLTDQTLIKSLDIDIEPALFLGDIQQGSIIVWLKSILNPKIESTLLNLNLVSAYLVEAKSSLINFINNRDTINSTSELLDLKNKLLYLAKNTNSNELGIYTPPSDKDLLSSIDKFQLASSELQAADKLYYLTGPSNSPLPVNRNFFIPPESLDNLLIKETKISESEMILKVKKPDYLGESKWEFRHGRRAINVKINDLEWLKKFKEREIIIAPGDAVKAKVEIVAQYDYQGELISTQHTIQKVIEIIPMLPNNQLSLFKDKN